MSKCGLNETVQLSDVVLFPLVYFRQEMKKYSYILHYMLQTENYLSSVWFGFYLFSHSLHLLQ